MPKSSWTPRAGQREKRGKTEPGPRVGVLTSEKKAAGKAGATSHDYSVLESEEKC